MLTSTSADTLSTAEAARLLGVAPRTLTKRADRGEIRPAVGSYPHGSRRYRRDDIERYARILADRWLRSAGPLDEPPAGTLTAGIIAAYRLVDHIIREA